MTTTETITLAQFVRQHLDNTTEVDPRKIAAAVATETPDSLLHEFYHQALVEYVRIKVGQSRLSAIRATRDTDDNAPTSIQQETVNGVRRPARSAKRLVAASAWARALQASIYVAGERKKFGSCTTDDLSHVVAGYQARIEQNAHWADYYSAVQSLMLKHNVETVADLPAAVAATLREPK